MLKQAIEIFKRVYNTDIDNKILDEYIPADGTYVIVDCNENDFYISQTVDIKYDKKNNQIDRTINNFEYICFVDYYSKLITMNKPIDNKKVIHSNNYMSFFIKKESLTNGKLTKDIIDNYYNTLKNVSKKYEGKKKSLEIYNSVEQEIGQVDIDLIEKIQEWVTKHIFVDFSDINGKDYLKIFFKFSKEDYIREGKRYLVPNIYNSNDTNISVDSKLYGLPANNIGLNSKKPYLENKTRKTSTPYLIDQNEVIIQKKFFDYLFNQAASGKYNIYFGEEIFALENGKLPDKFFNGLFMRIAKGMELEIHDSGVISQYSPNLIPEFEYQNVLDIEYDKLNGNYDTYKTLMGMQKLINEVLFSKFLLSNYFTEPKDITIHDDALVYSLITCRTALFDWFYKGEKGNVWSVLDRASINLIKGSIEKGYSTKAQDQFNLRISLKEYFEGGVKMADRIIIIKDTLREKISQKDTGYIESKEEYCFAVGQLAFYLISRNRGKNKPLSLAKPFINAKNDKFIKTRLKALYNQYDYDIKLNATRFKNMYAMIAGYELEGNIDEDMVIAGFIHSNLLYETKEESETINNSEDK